ncbi:MAG: hypothetical protein QME21_10180 [Anaerolineales bacterium]|nr:hypothetical protein [Anaerolineales bacterium]
MRHQKSPTLSILSIITGFLALIALVIIVSFAFKFLVSSSIGMALSTATASSPTEVTPTSFQHWRETAEAAVMETHFALIAMTTVTPPPTCCPPTNTPEPFVTGIFEAHVAPRPFANLWKGMVNGQQVRVYAGGLEGTYTDTPNLTKGVLEVHVTSPSLDNFESVRYETSELTGWLEIIAEDHYVLTLVGQNDQTLYFDVLTMQFVDSLTTTVTAPTITPLPPITSTAIPPTPYPFPEGYTPPPGQYPPPLTSTPLP